jgi:pimeloyl-ACP methyl ester carboxylesterase
MYGDCDLTDALAAYARLRPQAGTIYAGDYPLKRRPRGRSTYILGTGDTAVSNEWARRAARRRLGIEPFEIATGHSPMLSRPADLANLLDAVATEVTDT